MKEESNINIQKIINEGIKEFIKSKDKNKFLDYIEEKLGKEIRNKIKNDKNFEKKLKLCSFLLKKQLIKNKIDNIEVIL